jgi:hypothetical protein
VESGAAVMILKGLDAEAGTQRDSAISRA